jgi:hypothetical protein
MAEHRPLVPAGKYGPTVQPPRDPDPGQPTRAYWPRAYYQAGMRGQQVVEWQEHRGRYHQLMTGEGEEAREMHRQLLQWLNQTWTGDSHLNTGDGQRRNLAPGHRRGQGTSGMQ